MKTGDRVKIREGITGDDYEHFLGFNSKMAANAGKEGNVIELYTNSSPPYVEVKVEDTYYSYLAKDVIPLPEYKPGDWVVLGVNGSGWGVVAKGLVVKIADIGPHLKGKLFGGFDNYDFFIERHASYSKNTNLEQLMRSDGGGDSRNIKRFATSQEIAGMLDDVFKEYPLGSKVYCPRSCKVGKVSKRTVGVFYADEYPITVEFDNGHVPYTSDGFMQSAFRTEHPEWKLQLYKEVPSVFGGTTPTNKKFELNFTPTS